MYFSNEPSNERELRHQPCAQLEMLGNSMAWAAFAVVECMSSPKYHIKAIGYLAASQCFDRDTEVALLVVNLIRKVRISSLPSAGARTS